MADLATLDLRRAGPKAGLGKVRRGRVDAAVVGDRYASNCRRRGRCRSRQHRRCRSRDTQKNLAHCTDP